MLAMLSYTDYLQAMCSYKMATIKKPVNQDT